MPIEKLDNGKVVCFFGDGDILISPGHDVGGEEVQITLTQWPKSMPIDEPADYLKGMIIDNWSIKMYFSCPESVDSFIHVLETFKKERFCKYT